MSANTIDITKALDIVGWMTEGELAWLAEQATEHDTIIEMGSYLGRSTRALADHARGVVYAWDHWKGPDEPWYNSITPDAYREQLLPRFQANLSDHLASGKVVMVNAAHSSAVVETMPIPDMIFVDGDHTYPCVKHDIFLWLPLKPGTLICGHDWVIPAVERAVRELLPHARKICESIWSFQA